MQGKGNCCSSRGIKKEDFWGFNGAIFIDCIEMRKNSEYIVG